MQRRKSFSVTFTPTVVLALVVLAAFGAGAAGAAGVGDGKANPVQTEQFVPGITDFPSRLGEIGERAAEARLAQGSQQSPVITIEEGGFDWSAGATGALAAALLLLGSALAVRATRRSRLVLG